MLHSNIDLNELAKFSHRADKWWDLEGEFKTLHDINPLRFNFIAEKTHLTGKKFLDIGCGGGILSESLARAGALVTGIDASQELIQVAKCHAQNLGIEYQAITAEQFAELKPHSFDSVVCMELLEHVPDPNSLIQACAKLLKPQGDLFLSTINRHPKAYLYAILGAEYLMNLLPIGTHDYGKFLRPSEVSACARANDLSVVSMKGFGYNVLTKNYYMTDDIRVNYLIHCKKN